ncbi:hypothetical protein [Phenylobacterium sp.]|uniref:hypothetical protein n=1 Tax=Phenylobacterium sp. TaxID=1871053 RepID=UPI003BAA2CED
MNPPTRGLTQEDLIFAARIIVTAASDTDEALASRLVEAGFSEGSAYRLVAFLPDGLARPFLRELGVSTFAKAASVRDTDDRWFEVQLADQPEYLAAIQLGEAHLRAEAMDHDLYKALISSTATLSAADKAIAAGHDLKGASVAIALNSTCHAPHVVRKRSWIQRFVAALKP